MGEMDLVQLVAESSALRAPGFGLALHPTIPPTLAPPELLNPLSRFLANHPFDTNVFGMTRFPDDQDNSLDIDPLVSAHRLARAICKQHGLEFHLASDRSIVDDLWTNVTAHIWGSRYGIAFFEDRRSKSLNYNLTIEVGAMIVTGRRVVLLKDRSIDRMPTNLVGMIYKPLDLDDQAQVAVAIHKWITRDLGLAVCRDCPAA